MSAHLIKTARNFLDSQGMKVTHEWLTGCVEYFCNELANDSREDLCTMVKSQWILSDLRDVSPGCLPPGLCDQIKTTLSDVYALQVNYVIDVGTSAYQQVQKINKTDMTNIEVTNTSNQDPPPQRMLKLALTDGVQKIHGIEYKPMRNLSNILTPGIKVQIKGPVDCRRGVLMLEEKHLIVLGGEVEDLLESNHYKNILLKKIEEKDRASDNRQSVTAFTRQKLPVVFNNSNNPSVTQQNDRKVNIVQPINISLDAMSNDFDLNEDMFNDDTFDIKELEAIESKIINVTNNERNIHNSNIATTSKNIYEHKNENEIKNESTTAVPQDSVIIEDSLDANDFNHIFFDEPPIEETHQEENDKNYYLKIKDLTDMAEYVRLDKTFAVYARVVKVVGKLSLQKMQWILKCTLGDDSGELDVDVISDVLSAIIGYTPNEMTVMKKKIPSEPTLKSKLMDALDVAMSKIKKLNALLHITFNQAGPTLTRVED